MLKYLVPILVLISAPAASQTTQSRDNEPWTWNWDNTPLTVGDIVDPVRVVDAVNIGILMERHDCKAAYAMALDSRLDRPQLIQIVADHCSPK